MPLTQAGPVCDVCGKFIFPLPGEMVNQFDVWGLKNLIAHNKCQDFVKDAASKKDWKILPEGPLKKTCREDLESEKKPNNNPDGKPCPACNGSPCFCKVEAQIEKDEQEHHERY